MSQEGMIGEVRLFAGNFAPRTWAFCDGQLLPISNHQALFSILGTIYGGDGRTTFGLPDLRGRAPIHPGSGPGLTTYRLGQRAGAENTIILATNLPSHSHSTTIKATNEGDTDNPTDGFVAGNGANSFGTNADTTLKSEDTGNTGGDQSINNIQPVLAINYIICLMGVFPSRS